MESNQAGITAMITAYSRAYHATHDSPIIFNDFLADQLFTAEEHIFFNKSLAALLNQIDPELAVLHADEAYASALVVQLQTGPITLSRSRYCEDELAIAIQNGIEQYVILGAGFDTFSFRHPEFEHRLQVFEIDHPVTQGLKLQRIASAKWKIPKNLHLVPVDFSRDDLCGALQSSGYDPQKRSFFSLLGVTYYLPVNSIEDTLIAISKISAHGNILIFDYMDLDSFNVEKADLSTRLMQHITRQAGEPIQTAFSPAELKKLLDQMGFRLVVNLNPLEIEERFFKFRRDRYHAAANIHFGKAIVE